MPKYLLVDNDGDIAHSDLIADLAVAERLAQDEANGLDQEVKIFVIPDEPAQICKPEVEEV